MSTRSHIAIKDLKGNYQSVYCHNDGYPKGVGSILFNYYNTGERVRELLSNGQISFLGKEIEGGLPLDLVGYYRSNSFSTDKMDKDDKNLYNKILRVWFNNDLSEMVKAYKECSRFYRDIGDEIEIENFTDKDFDSFVDNNLSGIDYFYFYDEALKKWFCIDRMNGFPMKIEELTLQLVSFSKTY